MFARAWRVGATLGAVRAGTTCRNQFNSISMVQYYVMFVYLFYAYLFLSYVTWYLKSCLWLNPLSGEKNIELLLASQDPLSLLLLSQQVNSPILEARFVSLVNKLEKKSRYKVKQSLFHVRLVWVSPPTNRERERDRGTHIRTNIHLSSYKTGGNGKSNFTLTRQKGQISGHSADMQTRYGRRRPRRWHGDSCREANLPSLRTISQLKSICFGDSS